MEAVLAGFGEAAQRVGVERIRAGRHHIEHAEMVDAALIARMAELGAGRGRPRRPALPARARAYPCFPTSARASNCPPACARS